MNAIVREPVDEKRRRMLLIATSAAAGAATAGVAVPFVASWFPSARSLAAGAPVEYDISRLEPGQQITVEWRGKPVWILARNFHLLNTRTVLIILYIGINLPLAIWMLRSFFREIPRELIEAAEIDGAGLKGQLTSIILPLAAPGIAATALLCVIFAIFGSFQTPNCVAISFRCFGL